MKNKIIIIVAYFLSLFTYAQVAIGKSSITTLPSSTNPNPGISLEFGNTGSTTDLGDATKQKGILLPWVTSATAVKDATNAAGTATPAVAGTLIFDISDKKVKLFKSATTWDDLTVDTTGAVNTALQDGKTELKNAKVSIGAPTSTPGILVLEHTNKAMVLPIVKGYFSILSPSAGMMVYDSSNDMLCFYNGSKWTFWKP